MKIDSTWIGVKEYTNEPIKSLDEYGFASSFSHIPEDDDVYDCLLSDEEDDEVYIYCQLSITDVKNIVRENPEIPINETELKKSSMCYMLFMIDLYCDIYELIDFTDADRIRKEDVVLADEKIESLDDDTKLRRPNRQWKMTRTDALKVFKFLKGRGYYPKTGHLFFLLDVPEINIVECLDILSKYGSSKYKFIDMFRFSDDGELYFKRNKSYFKLKD